MRNQLVMNNPALPDPNPDTAQADEELIAKCIDAIWVENKASTSLLQRRFRLGYTRASELMSILEQRGYIGPGEGAQPRKILKERPMQPLVGDKCPHCGSRDTYWRCEHSGGPKVLQCNTCGHILHRESGSDDSAALLDWLEANCFDVLQSPSGDRLSWGFGNRLRGPTLRSAIREARRKAASL